MGFLPIAAWVLASLSWSSWAVAPTPAAPDEIVSSEFDLSGWLAVGAATLEGSALEHAPLSDLFDAGGSTYTTRANPARYSLDFQSQQVVHQVVLEPGSSDPYAVTLTVVDASGGRFAAGEAEIRDGNAAVFQLADVALTRIELAIQRLDGEGSIHLSRLRVTGRLSIRSLELDDVPETLPEGGRFPIRIVGRDTLGGRPDLTDMAQLRVTPERALALLERGVVETRVGGPISIAPVLRTLEGPAQSLLVSPLGRAPAAPTVHPGMSQIRLELTGEPPFEVFRRSPGTKSGRAVGRSFGNQFFDERIEPGTPYWYSTRRIDRFGNPVTALGEEARTRSLNRRPQGMQSPGRLPVLVVLYEDSFAEGEADAILHSLEYVRLFLYRQSRGQLVLDVTPMRMTGPTPSTAGPSMAAIAQQLRDQGVRNDEFGVVFAFANDLGGNWGNFSVLGRTGGAFGRDAVMPVPPSSFGPDPAAAWSFVHELQHVIHQKIAASVGISGRPSGHFDQDLGAGLIGQAVGRPFDVGDAWDGQAALLRDMAWWPAVGAPYRRPLEIVDTDGDGLADDDPWLPLDEARFGSDPAATDTDGDGLDDMAEAAAGLYGPTHPGNPDTDGDGLLDGADPYPLSDFAGQIPRGTDPVPLASGPEFVNPSIELAACWNETSLVLRVTTRPAVDVFVDLDGSGALGRWETDVDTGTDDMPGSDVWCGPARLALRAHQVPQGVFVGDRLLEGAALTTEVIDGRHVLTATLPAALGPGAADVSIPEGAPKAPGLRLTAGSVLGLAVTVRPSAAGDLAPLDPWPAGAAWLSLFETHRLLDATLVGDTTPVDDATQPDDATPIDDTTPVNDAPPPEDG